MQIYERRMRATTSKAELGRVEWLVVSPVCADSIESALSCREAKQAGEMLEGLWYPLGLSGRPNIVLVLKHIGQ